MRGNMGNEKCGGVEFGQSVCQYAMQYCSTQYATPHPHKSAWPLISLDFERRGDKERRDNGTKAKKAT